MQDPNPVATDSSGSAGNAKLRNIELDEALQRGKNDSTTMVNISVTVYYTTELKGVSPDIKKEVTRGAGESKQCDQIATNISQFLRFWSSRTVTKSLFNSNLYLIPTYST